MTRLLLLPVGALLFATACSDSNSPTAPQFKVDQGNANSGFFRCTKQGAPTVNKVTADNRQFYVKQGYTCTAV
jgi:hypothetical protein